MQYKDSIYSATTKEEVASIKLVYTLSDEESESDTNEKVDINETE